MPNKGQADTMHVGLFILVFLLLVILGFVGYMLFKGKESNVSVYQPDSKPKLTTLEIRPSTFGCANVKVDEFMEGKKNANITNKTTN